MIVMLVSASWLLGPLMLVLLCVVISLFGVWRLVFRTMLRVDIADSWELIFPSRLLRHRAAFSVINWQLQVFAALASPS